MKDRPGHQPIAFDLQARQPGPPALELIELLDALPQHLRRQIEVELAPIGDDSRGHLVEAMSIGRGRQRQGAALNAPMMWFGGDRFVM